MDIFSIRSCLDDCCFVVSLGYSPLRLEEFIRELQELFPNSGRVLKECLLLFSVLCYSKTRFDYLFDSFEEVLTSDKHCITRRRFGLMLSMIMYFQNSRRTTLLKPIWFLLHFRGLSYTGFHVLHKFGLCPSVRSISTFLNDRSELDLHSPFQNVWWMDNLRRQLKGVVPADVRIDWTVVGSVPFQSVSPLRLDYVAIGDIFSDEGISKLYNTFIADVPLNYPVCHSVDLSVPLRSRTSTKYKFVEVDILPVTCGTLLGTVQILDYLKKNVFDEFHFSFVVLDYDLYWRTYKLLFTRSIIGGFFDHRERLILILGPWHIYKSLCVAIWNWGAPLLFADLWLRTFDRRLPLSPDLKDITLFFVAIFLGTRGSAIWMPDNSILGNSIALLLYQLIPLVGFPGFYSISLIFCFRPYHFPWLSKKMTLISFVSY